jgi:hypothetical protein
MDNKEIARDLTVALINRDDGTIPSGDLVETAKFTVHLYKEILKDLDTDQPKDGTVQIKHY